MLSDERADENCAQAQAVSEMSEKRTMFYGFHERPESTSPQTSARQTSKEVQEANPANRNMSNIFAHDSENFYHVATEVHASAAERGRIGKTINYQLLTTDAICIPATINFLGECVRLYISKRNLLGGTIF